MLWSIKNLVFFSVDAQISQPYSSLSEKNDQRHSRQANNFNKTIAALQHKAWLHAAVGQTTKEISWQLMAISVAPQKPRLF